MQIEKKKQQKTVARMYNMEVLEIHPETLDNISIWILSLFIIHRHKVTNIWSNVLNFKLGDTYLLCQIK